MTVMPLLSQHAGALEKLQRIVFPALAFAERLRAEHYRAHLRVFPEGQFVLTNLAPAATVASVIGGDRAGAHLLYRAGQEHVCSIAPGSSWSGGWGFAGRSPWG